ncbi:MAG: diacylglyceryl transferase [Desulfococcus sp. 4484_241]|nr:MAG: diacylglyceryl transferase [Desulfococcus sp. 4484_241]
MLPVIHVGDIPTYYLFMLFGIITGFAAFIFSEPVFWTAPGFCGKLWPTVRAAVGYLAVVFLCLQGANYFHYFFDNIPPSLSSALTWRDILFTPPFRTVKVLYGAIFFYPLGIWVASLVMGRKFADLLNSKAFIVFIVLGFTRIGCFFNGCCYGIVSETFGVCFPPGSAAAAEHWARGLTRGFAPPASLPVIPTQPISALFLLCLAVISFRHYRNGKSHTFAKSVFAYAVFRFTIEFIRDDMDRAYWLGLSASQWISLAVFVVAGIWTAIKRKREAQV